MMDTTGGGVACLNHSEEGLAYISVPALAVHVQSP